MYPQLCPGASHSFFYSGERNREKIDFLDLTIHKNKDNRLEYTIFHKPQSRNTLLPPDSNHPVYAEHTGKANDYAHQVSWQAGMLKVSLNRPITRARETERQRLLTGTDRNQDKTLVFPPHRVQPKSIILKQCNTSSKVIKIEEKSQHYPLTCFPPPCAQSSRLRHAQHAATQEAWHFGSRARPMAITSVATVYNVTARAIPSLKKIVAPQIAYTCWNVSAGLLILVKLNKHSNFAS
jgi:hypothetical protein